MKQEPEKPVRKIRPLLAALMICLSASDIVLSTGRAHAAEEESVLAGTGICYPSGFDINTVGAVPGKVRDVIRPERGPVRFRLEAFRETYTVLAAPKWFWDSLIPALPDGTDLLVRGSKALGRDGTLYLIAQELSFPAAGASIRLRNPQGRPLWMSRRTPGECGEAMGGTDRMRGRERR
jgi:hypothetical protein